jgi:branched-chain amino acid transport system substrate-binding protein
MPRDSLNAPLRITHHVLRITCFVFLLTACQFPCAVRPTIKIGLVAPFEGRYRYVGYDVIYAARMAIREINAVGGVGGYAVELVAYDDGADPEMAITQARKLTVDDAVVAALGHFRETTTATAARLYSEAGIPLAAPVALGDLPDAPLVCHLGPSADVMASSWLDHLETLAVDQAALATEGGQLGDALKRRATERDVRIAPVILVEGIGASETHPTATAILDARVDVVFCDADPVTAGETIAALRAAGWTGDFVGGPDMAADAFAAIAGEAARGAIYLTPWPRLNETLGGQSFAEAYQTISNGVPPGPLALPAYEATWILLEALAQDIAAHGAPTRAGVSAALHTIKREGRLGSIIFEMNDGVCRQRDAPIYWIEK